MFEGDLESGELEIGQIAAYLNEIKSAKEIIEEIMNEFESQKSKIGNIQF